MRLFNKTLLSLIAQLVKNLPALQEMGSIPGLGRSPREGKSYPLQYSGLENCMDCIVPGVSESDTAERLSLSPFTTLNAIFAVLGFHSVISFAHKCIWNNAE